MPQLLPFLWLISCTSCDFAPYKSAPFSVEKFVVFDSIDATYGSLNSAKHPEDVLTNYFLVTGYADTIEAERKIDSMLLSLVNPDYINMRSYSMYFFKKARRYNNAYARSDRDYMENNTDKYMFLRYEYSYYDHVFKTIGISKERQNGEYIALIWNSTDIAKDSLELKKGSIQNIPSNKRCPGLEKWFDVAVKIKKEELKRRSVDVSHDIRRYVIRKY